MSEPMGNLLDSLGLTMVGENGPELDGWRLPPRCCGDWQTKLHCTTCGTLVPDNCVLGEN